MKNKTTTETDGNVKARHRNVGGLNQLTIFRLWKDILNIDI